MAKRRLAVNSKAKKWISSVLEASVESGDQPTDLGSALLSSRMVGVYRA